MKRYLVIVMCLSLSVVFTSCRKREKVPSQTPELDGQAQTQPQRNRILPFRSKKTGKVGFQEWNGRIVIGAWYEDGQEFSEDVAGVKVKGKWGFINKTGKFVIQPHYDEVTPFKDGLAKVRVRDEWVQINKAGERQQTAGLDRQK